MRRSAFILVALLSFMASPAVALANGGHIHIGTTAIPPIVVWISGGVFGFFVAMFVLQWLRFNLARRRGPDGPRERSVASHREEESDG